MVSGPLPDMSTRHVELVIVGAGACGLAASVRATAHGIDHVVLEASDRIGGRLHTVTRVDGSAWDRGAHSLLQPPINPLVHEAETRGWEVARSWHPSNGVLLNDVWLSEIESTDIWHQIDECEDLARDLLPVDEDAALLELIDPDFVPGNAVAAVMELTYGRSGGLVSARDVASLAPHEGAWPVSAGFGALISEIYRDVTVQLDAAAKVIDWGTDPVRVDLGDELIEADRVLVTVSTGVLASEQIIFAPELPDETRSAIAGLPMGSLNRLVFDIDGPMPDVAGGAPVFSIRDGESICFKAEGADGHAVVATLAGEFGVALEAEGEDAMFEAVAEHAASVYGSGVRHSFDQAEASMWGRDPWVRGAWSVALPGSADARQVLATPVEGRLYFAGEATSRNSYGTVHGARSSGIAAIDRIAFQTGRLTEAPDDSDTTGVFVHDF